MMSCNELCELSFGLASTLEKVLARAPCLDIINRNRSESSQNIYAKQAKFIFSATKKKIVLPWWTNWIRSSLRNSSWLVLIAIRLNAKAQNFRESATAPHTQQIQQCVDAHTHKIRYKIRNEPARTEIHGNVLFYHAIFMVQLSHASSIKQRKLNSIMYKSLNVRIGMCRKQSKFLRALRLKAMRRKQKKEEETANSQSRKFIYRWWWGSKTRS